MAPIQTLTAEKLATLDVNDGVVLDVRTGMEHGEKRLCCKHEHVPLDVLQPTAFMNRLNLGKDSAVYILCRTGNRATQAAEKFAAEGYRNVYVVVGGLVACESCGHKIEGRMVDGAHAPSKGPISLERQVRIAAGGLAASGALLGLVANPLFTLIPLFVGAGLVFAGVTDRCGMALLLTKAPWNKASCCAKP